MTTKEKLVKALQEANAPKAMIDRASQGYYDDFETTIEDPITRLIIDARIHGLENIATRAVLGEFDGTEEESATASHTAVSCRSSRTNKTTG